MLFRSSSVLFLAVALSNLLVSVKSDKQTPVRGAINPNLFAALNVRYCETVCLTQTTHFFLAQRVRLRRINRMCFGSGGSAIIRTTAKKHANEVSSTKTLMKHVMSSKITRAQISTRAAPGVLQSSSPTSPAIMFNGLIILQRKRNSKTSAVRPSSAVMSLLLVLRAQKRQLRFVTASMISLATVTPRRIMLIGAMNMICAKQEKELVARSVLRKSTPTWTARSPITARTARAIQLHLRLKCPPALQARPRVSACPRRPVQRPRRAGLRPTAGRVNPFPLPFFSLCPGLSLEHFWAYPVSLAVCLVWLKIQKIPGRLGTLL